MSGAQKSGKANPKRKPAEEGIMGNVHIYTEEERREARTDTFYEVINGKLMEVGTHEYNQLCSGGTAA